MAGGMNLEGRKSNTRSRAMTRTKPIHTDP